MEASFLIESMKLLSQMATVDSQWQSTSSYSRKRSTSSGPAKTQSIYSIVAFKASSDRSCAPLQSEFLGAPTNVKRALKKNKRLGRRHRPLDWRY